MTKTTAKLTEVITTEESPADVPERIWATPYDEHSDGGTYCNAEIRPDKPNGDATEYHRSDLTAAAVAAALQGAVETVDKYLMVQTGLDVEHVCNVKDIILDQIDPTGLAALEAYADKVRDEALEEAARSCDKIAETTHDDVYWGVSPDREIEKRTAKRIAAELRAMAKPVKERGE